MHEPTSSPTVQDAFQPKLGLVTSCVGKLNIMVNPHLDMLVKIHPHQEQQDRLIFPHILGGFFT